MPSQPNSSSRSSSSNSRDSLMLLLRVANDGQCTAAGCRDSGYTATEQLFQAMRGTS